MVGFAPDAAGFVPESGEVPDVEAQPSLETQHDVGLLPTAPVVGIQPAAVGGYTDVSSDSFAAEHVAALAERKVFDGTDCSYDRFCPEERLPRWAMAVWLVRVLDGRDPIHRASRQFDDIDGDPWWERHVERLAQLGVTLGCDSGPPARFCPYEDVTRAQMAAFLMRAFGLPDGRQAGFADVSADSHFNAHINALAASGITVGCATGPPRFCPAEHVKRGQMAAFLGRAIAMQPTAVLRSSAPALVEEAFAVDISFSAPVSGLSQSDIRVVNGSVSGLTGSGSRYQATVTPTALGAVVVGVAPGSATAEGDGGIGYNTASGLLMRIRVDDPARPRPGIDAWDRTAVLDDYNAEFGRTEPDSGYTGDVAACIAGTTIQQFRDSVIQRAIWYRRMAGLGPVVENPVYSAGAQQTALMMAAQGELSHYPGEDWACYTEVGTDYAAESNLGLVWSAGYVGFDSVGVSSVDGYMRDSGDNTRSVGHRRNILHPQTQQMGTGDVAGANAANGYSYAANALNVVDDNIFAERPPMREERGFVAWPPSGYVPADLVWGRWSFSLPQADFSAASVTVTDDAGPLQVEVTTRDESRPGYFTFPESAIVWEIAGYEDSSQLPAPSYGDHCYTVEVSGVRLDSLSHGGAVATYEYAVCVFDPSS